MTETMENGRCSVCGRAPSVRSALSPQDVLPPGTLLDGGNIVVGEPLGQGGFGITYVAKDNEFGAIALKEFFPRSFATRSGATVVATGSDEKKYARYMSDFQREVKHLLNLKSHPNIVKVYFDLDENNTFYYGMELLKGESLKKLLLHKHHLEPIAAFQLLEPIGDALSYAHRLKTIHRDIAPDNIFLRANAADPEHPIPCLIDFGAAFTDKDGFTFVAPSVRKNGFSPPDQILPYEQQGPFIDVYALTATYYNMITGTVPPPSTDRHITPLRAASQLNPSVSPAVDQVISKGMELNHEKRYPDIDTLVRELRRALGITEESDHEPAVQSVPDREPAVPPVVEQWQPVRPAADRKPPARPAASRWFPFRLAADRKPVPPAAEQPRPAQLKCTKGPMRGCVFSLQQAEQVVGREGALLITDSDRLASRKHCKLVFENGNWYVVDLKSHNGTVINGALAEPNRPILLSPGDVLQIGFEEFVFNPL
ncbi:MAG: FHA domain-containing protein [Candidatus Ventricola sp.]